MSSLHPRLSAWRDRGRMIEVASRRLFVVDVAGQREQTAPALLLLHGFPSCSLDFHRVVDRLARNHRVVVHDHLGFGLSEKPPEAAYSLFDQADLAIELWQKLGVDAGHLVAHDYGTSVATEIVARRLEGRLPFALRGVTLSNGSVHVEMAQLRFSQRLLRTPLVGEVFARLASRPFFRGRMRALWADRDRADAEDLDALFDALVHGGGRRVLTRLIGYLGERVTHAERWVGALARAPVPVHLLWGREDPVAVPAIAERLAIETPGSTLTWLEGVGHYPMLEAPSRWADALLSALED